MRFASPSIRSVQSGLRFGLLALLGAVLLVSTADLAVAQSPPFMPPGFSAEDRAEGGEAEASAIESLSREEIEAEIEAVRAEAEPLRARLAADAAGAGEESAAAPGDDPVASQLRSLEKTRSLLEQQIGEFDRHAALAEDHARLGRLEADGAPALLVHPAPFGFDDLDPLLSRLESSRARLALLDDAVAAGAEQRDEVRARLRSAEQKLRQHDDRVAEGEASPDPVHRRELELAARAAEEELVLVAARLECDYLERGILEKRIGFLDGAVVWCRSNLRPSAEELEARLQILEAERETLRGRLAEVRDEIRRRQGQLLRAQTDAGEAPGPGDGSAEIDALRAILDLADERLRLLEDASERRATLADLWRARHRLAAKPKPSASAQTDVRHMVDSSLGELERSERLLRARLEELRTRRRSLDDLRSAASSSAESRDDAAWLRRQQEAVAAQIDFVGERLVDLGDALTVARRLAEEASAERFDVGAAMSSLWRRVEAFWNWQITSVDDRPITLGKVILALLLLFAGYKASKRISQSLGRILQSRFNLSSSGAAALQNISFYVLLVAFFFWALQLVSIPLTVFTLLGGVVAIGIGFGSQNVVNNFISGLILMVERPIKVGDLVEVDGTVGSVEQIGLRSARVRAGDNTHVIVPNSTFLEQKVLNWTVSDDLVRTQVDVGVAYGSDTERVAELMRQALDDEPVVVANMPKEVLFMDFGDNALAFRAYFWIRVGAYLDTMRAQSKLRFRIDRLFADADIVIAFPQRDVHLDTLAPLEVRLLGRPGPSATESD